MAGCESERCTLCGGWRGLPGASATNHYATAQHQRAVREWDEGHRRLGHHDGHVALRIDCHCEDAA